MNPLARAASSASARTFAATVADVNAKRPDFGGMTVNERLSAAGLVGQFDSAIVAGDHDRAVELLSQVGMGESSAASTVETVLADPARYGYPRPN